MRSKQQSTDERERRRRMKSSSWHNGQLSPRRSNSINSIIKQQYRAISLGIIIEHRLKRSIIHQAASSSIIIKHHHQRTFQISTKKHHPPNYFSYPSDPAIMYNQLLQYFDFFFLPQHAHFSVAWCLFWWTRGSYLKNRGAAISFSFFACCIRAISLHCIRSGFGGSSNNNNNVLYFIIKSHTG